MRGHCSEGVANEQQRSCPAVSYAKGLTEHGQASPPPAGDVSAQTRMPWPAAHGDIGGLPRQPGQHTSCRAEARSLADTLSILIFLSTSETELRGGGTARNQQRLTAAQHISPRLTADNEEQGPPSRAASARQVLIAAESWHAGAAAKPLVIWRQPDSRDTDD